MRRTKEAIFTHFSKIELAPDTRTYAGVEYVMDGQQRILEDRGWRVGNIVGDGDPNDQSMSIYPPIRSGYANGEHTREDVSRVRNDLQKLFGTKPVIAHNSTNAEKHNPPFGEAIAAIAEERIDANAPPVTLWYHDARGAEPHELTKYFPHRREGTVVCVSKARERELLHVYDEIRKGDSTQLPEDIRVVYNPINGEYLAAELPVPSILSALAPEFERFTQKYKLPQTQADAEATLFDPEIFKFVVPARIVEQKNIAAAIEAANAYAEMTRQRTSLIVTGPPDERKRENITYWQDTQKRVREGTSSNLKVLFLGGVEATYMPWLLATNSDTGGKMLMLPSNNEGFSMPPSEAACVGTPSVLSDLPVFHETTGGNALMLPLDLWKDPTQIAKKIAEYMASSQATTDVRNLTSLVHQRYSTEVIGDQLESLLVR